MDMYILRDGDNGADTVTVSMYVDTMGRLDRNEVKPTGTHLDDIAYFARVGAVEQTLALWDVEETPVTLRAAIRAVATAGGIPL